MTELPAGWSDSRLEEFVEVILGQSPPGDSYNEDGVGLPFFQGKAEFGHLRPTIRKWTTDPRKIALEDDVLLSVRAPVGPTNVAPCECVVGRGLAALRPLGGIDSFYVLYGMRATADALASGATGTTFGAVSGAQVRNHHLPLAPLYEQRRIVAALEVQFSRLDAAEKLLAQAKAKLAALSAAIVSNAMKPGWPRVQVGDIGDGSRHALAIGPFGSNLKVSDYREKGVPLIFVRNIRSRRFSGSGSKFVSESKAAELAAHTARGGDVLVTKMGDPPGDAAVYPKDSPDAIITADCIKISVGDAFDPTFVALVIGSPAFRRQVLAATKGVAQKKVSLGRFKAIEIPKPPFDEQQLIAAEIGQQLSLTNSLCSAIEATHLRSGGLRDSILRRAFLGELAPQDPADEPAWLLLERIAANRAAAASSKQRRKVTA